MYGKTSLHSGIVAFRASHIFSGEEAVAIYYRRHIFNDLPGGRCDLNTACMVHVYKSMQTITQTHTCTHTLMHTHNSRGKI